jgi:hypothetical protein
MYEYRGLQDVLFIALYIGTATCALLACLYLLLRRGNAFLDENIKSSRRLRHWTAAFMSAVAASHAWWYAIGIYWLSDDRLVRNITNIMLDHVTLIPLMMAVLLALLQDRHRPLWPWLVAQLPVVIFAVVGIVQRNAFIGCELPHYWQLAVIIVFVTYYIYALWHYNRWLLDNYADLEHKEVWQSMVFAMSLFAVYMIYTSNAGELVREYLSQVITLFIIAFLVWRVETLQGLEDN